MSATVRGSHCNISFIATRAQSVQGDPNHTFILTHTFLKIDFIEHRATILLYLKGYIIFLAELSVLYYNTVFYFIQINTLFFGGNVEFLKNPKLLCSFWSFLSYIYGTL